MKAHHNHFIFNALAIAGLACSFSCGTSDNGTPGSGGSGTSGAAGASGTGTSGASGSSSGSGGGSGTAGSDAGVTHQLNDTFTTTDDLAGYAFSTYADMNTTNLTGDYTVDGGTEGGAEGGEAGAAGASGDGGVAPTPPTLEWTGTDGDPDMGALKVTVTYTDYRQYVDIVKQINPALDLTGATLKAQVRIVSTSRDFPGGIQFHASSGTDYAYQGSAGQTFGTAVGTWVPITLPLTATAPFDPAAIVQLGIQVYTGDIPTTTPDFGDPLTIVFEIDTVTD